MVAEVKQGEATTFFKIIKMAENRFKLDFQHCQAGNSSSRMERDNQIPLWPWLALASVPAQCWNLEAVFAWSFAKEKCLSVEKHVLLR